MRLNKILWVACVIFCIAVFAGCGSSTQKVDGGKKTTDFPKKEITIVVPWNAGGGNDLLTNIALLAEDPIILVVKADAPWNNAKELVEYMKANPNKIKIATPGTNNVHHAIIAMLSTITDTQFQHVPFEGGSVIIPQIMGGHIDVGLLKPSESMAQLKNGTLKAIAVNADNRISSLPDVQTFKENGYDLFKSGTVKQISLIVCPAGVDPVVKDRLTELFNKAIQSEEYQKYALELNVLAPARNKKELDTDVENVLNSEVFKTIFKNQ